MLSSLRQTPRLFPLSIPRVARLNTNTYRRKQDDDALLVLQTLSTPENGPSSTAAEVPQPSAGPTPAQLDSMHHFIPPAQSPILQLFTNLIMRDGKHAAAARRISAMLLHIHVMTQSQPMPIVELAVRLASPAVKVNRQKKGGGKIMLKPVALSERQRTRMGIEWIINAANAKGRPGKLIEDRLAREILAIIRDEDNAVIKQKAELHTTVLTNRGNITKK